MVLVILGAVSEGDVGVWVSIVVVGLVFSLSGVVLTCRIAIATLR